jgi:Holliday junction resolvase RusA-like endonuclease|tara:strand:- start:387 stop:812 length:426 start_codon:yes stop_codon:yes gene_type:complete
MISQEFVIHGPPQQWTVYIKDKGPPSPSFKRMKAWQHEIRLILKEEWEHDIIDGPIELDTEFYRPRGKTCPTKREPAITKWLDKHIMTRPDLTNYRKSCEDACIGILFVDDSQVVGGKMRKRYAPQYSEGYTVIKIREVEL